jgi:hypothetical protein
MEDTVEKDVEGLAQQIILEDEQRRAQELVSDCNMLNLQSIHLRPRVGCLQHRAEKA